MSVKRFFPLIAGALAVTMLAAPVSAGDGGGRWTTPDEQLQWGEPGFDGQVTRRNGRNVDRWQSREDRKRARRAERRQQRRAERRAMRQGKTAPGGYGAGGYARTGPLNDTLGGYDLPDYIGGYNQPPDNGHGSINEALRGYDLPDYIGGYNQPPGNGHGSINEALSGHDMPDYIGGYNQRSGGGGGQGAIADILSGY